MSIDITSFSGDYAWLSNFEPCDIILDGVPYLSVENAYQAAKTLDPKERIQFQGCSPGAAKRKGRSVTLRPGWDDIKLQIMKSLLYQKYRQPYFRQLLIETGDRTIIEGNTWGDTFYGVCNGVGENRLGQAIMAIRIELQLGEL